MLGHEFVQGLWWHKLLLAWTRTSGGVVGHLEVMVYDTGQAYPQAVVTYRRHQHICFRLSQFAAIFPMFCLVTCFSMMLLCFPFGCSGGLASHSLQSSVPHHRPQVEMRRRENLARSVAFRGPRFVARCGLRASGRWRPNPRPSLQDCARMSDVKLLVENLLARFLNC